MKNDKSYMKIKVAVVHYWWFRTRGGEKVLIEILKLYPNADLFLHCGDKELIYKELEKIKFKGNLYFSFVNKVPFISKIYQFLFFLMPFASECFNFDNYNLVISSESGPSKNIITRVDSTHICYCHSPMRYIWDMKNIYESNLGFLKKIIFRYTANKMRIIDYISSSRVDYFIANSNFIKQRISKYYKKDSYVIYPPVNLDRFYISKKKNFYLLFGELIIYKNPQVAIEAFNTLGYKLYVIGDGPLINTLKNTAKNNIKFLGRVNDDLVAKFLSEAKALIYPGIEDFGIIPVEAMASGTPVIAYNKGGVKDTIKKNTTGILYDSDTSESLINAIQKFEKNINLFDSNEIREYSFNFSESLFRNKFSSYIIKCLKKN